MIRRVSIVTLQRFAVGCIVALAAVGFVDAMLWLNDLLFISPRSRMLAGDQAWLIAATIAVPTLGGWWWACRAR